MKSQLAHNMQFLRNSLPGVYKELVNGEPLFKVQIEQIEDADAASFFVAHGSARCFVHSVYSVEAEMNSMFKHVNKNAEVLVLYGFGCGHALEYIESMFSNIHTIVIIEPCLELFQRVLQFIELEKLFSGFRNVVVLLNKSSQECARYLQRILYQNFSHEIAFAYHLSYTSLFSRYIAELDAELLSFMRQHRVNFATQAAFKTTWMKNQLFNIGLSERSHLEDIIHTLRGIDAIIVSAGPSLDKNVHLLNKVNHRALIVAVGTGIKILDSHGIVPHLRIAFDGGDNERRIFEGINTRAVPLVYANTLNPVILKEYHGPKIEFVMDAEYLVRYLYEKLGLNRLLFSSSYSVAGVAADILCRAGCRRLVFIGQDLCYTDEKLYASGSWHTADGSYDFEKDGFIRTSDVWGNNVYTTRPFLAMKRSLEGIVIKYPETEFINATEGGLRIEGMKHKSLKDVLMTLDDSPQLKRTIGSIAELACTKKPAQVKLRKVLDELLEEVSEIIELNDYRLKRLEQIESCCAGESQLYGLDFYDWKLKQNELFRKVMLPELAAHLDAVHHKVRSDFGEKAENDLLAKLHKLRGELFYNYALALKESAQKARDSIKE